MNETVLYDSLETPAGTFLVAVDRQGALVATAFGDLESLRSRITGRHFVRDTKACAAALTQVADWMKRKRRDFTLALSPEGTDFQKRVWEALRAIPYGQTRSYGQIAKMLKSSARAVGRANATNPIALMIPCHRVIGADGKLTGYAFGEEVKKRLLSIEGA